MATTDQKVEKLIAILQAEPALKVDYAKAFANLDTPAPLSAFKKVMAEKYPEWAEGEYEWEDRRESWNDAIEAAHTAANVGPDAEISINILALKERGE